MADFRRVVTALAVLALLSGFAVTANAQTFACTASAAVPPLLRAEGLTELTGDIVMNCTGGVAPAAGSTVQPTQLANISIFLGNTTVTSRIVDSNNGSDALLLIDEGAGGVFVNSAVTTGCGNGLCEAPPTTGGGYSVDNPNAFRGIVSGNSVTFIGIPIIPPGTTTPGATRIFRITNIRANASTVGAGPAGTPGQVQAFISITGPASVPISGLATQVVGFVQNGLSFSVRNSANDDSSGGFTIQQCSDTGRGTARNHLRFSENFATAFKLRGDTTQNTPGAVYNTESGFVVPGQTFTGIAGTATLGLADFGTRLKATFANIPTGVRVYVSTTNVNSICDPLTQPGTCTAGTETRLAQLVAAEGAAFTPAAPLTNVTSPKAGLQIAEVVLSGGAGAAVWEVRANDNLLTQNYDFALYFSSTANVAGNSPLPGVQGTVAGSFAPTSTVTTASTAAPIPRFVDTGTARNIVRVAICRTNILWPYVTNASGFDTGLAIANTTKDPFGTGAQAGTCTLNFYGDNAPSAITTPSIPSGTVYANAASVAAPNFSGYVIAVCNFQFAHGFAFVQSSVGYNPTTAAMGYLGLIIPSDSRSAAEALNN
jgi:hypothetical protein